MKQLLFSLLVIATVSCSTVQVSDPGYAAAATKLPVKGINGWQVNQRLSFGDYSTSKIRRGWDFTSSLSYTKFRISPEEAILAVFDIRTDQNYINQHNRFQYTIENGKLAAEIYATEKFKENQLVYKSNNPWIGSASKTNRYEYAFTAAVLPLTLTDQRSWLVVLINKYDLEKDKGRGVFEPPYVEEEGYATNGKENILIRPLRTDKLKRDDGKEQKIIGGKILTGYELTWNSQPAATIDILNNNIWLHNELGAENKLVVSAISSAILLKRMQDVEKDKVAQHY